MDIKATKRIVVDLDPELYAGLLRVKNETGQTIRAQVQMALRATDAGPRRSENSPPARDNNSADADQISEDEF